MAELNYDKMSDEDFENLLDNIDDVETEDVETEEDDDFEDTDQQDEESELDEEDTETNQDDDDDFEDTEDDSEDEDEDPDEENTHNVSEDNEDDVDEDGFDEEPDETVEAAAPESMTAEDKVDYKKAYEEALANSAELEDFRNQVTGDFIANGRTMSAPRDPKKIIQAFQKAAGFDDKMKAFKKYRPFITPLQEKGILDNPDQFNLMMSAMGGDTEAIKKIISNAEIDPIELDMENIDYTPTNSVSSDIELAYEDVMQSAEQSGVKEQVQKVVGGDWDDQSVVELLDDPQNSADLVHHLSTGIYDLVQERIAQKKMVDQNGVFGNQKSIEQYREAAKEIEGEYRTFLQQQENNGSVAPEQQETIDRNEEFQFSEEEIQEEIERIKAERSYAAKVEKKNVEASNGRKKAASLSKKKPRSKKKNTTFDPGKLSDDEFTAYLDGMIYD